jgi:SAM-dependent methyltransferase
MPTFNEMLGDDYFVRRGPMDVDYEAYWSDGYVDPDGQTRRHRLEERESHLAQHPELVDFLKGHPGGRILDVGCGPGWFLSALNPEKWSVRVGVEPSKAAAGEAKKSATWVYPDIGLRDLFELPRFDVVLMHHVIEHVRDPDVLMQKASSLLADDGWFVVGCPDFDSLCARRYGEGYRMIREKSHVSLWSTDSLLRFVRDELKLKVHRVEYPFLGTVHDTDENLLGIRKEGGVSPPWYVGAEQWRSGVCLWQRWQRGASKPFCSGARGAV